MTGKRARKGAAALAVVGVLAGLAFLVLPVQTAFAGDPLLRIHAFGTSASGAVTGVDCGTPLANLGRHGDGLNLYALARDHACRQASSRRAATAVAVVAILGLLGAIGLARADKDAAGAGTATAVPRNEPAAV